MYAGVVLGARQYPGRSSAGSASACCNRYRPRIAVQLQNTMIFGVSCCCFCCGHGLFGKLERVPERMSQPRSRTDLRNILLFGVVYALLTLVVGNSYYLLIMHCADLGGHGTQLEPVQRLQRLVSSACGLLRLGAYWWRCRCNCGTVAVDQHRAGGWAGRFAGALIALRPSACAGIISRWRCWPILRAALHLRMAGYQEVALPMHRNSPGGTCVCDPRVYVVLALLLLLLTLLLSAFWRARASALVAGHQAECGSR